MSAVDTTARVLALIPWLLERPGASVDEAASTFAVDRQTILSDLETIGYCGLPGLGGGDLFEIEVVEGRVVVQLAHAISQPLRLEPGEALGLLLAAETAAAALGDELPALRSALDTVRHALGVPAEVRVQLAENGTQWLATLRQAIDEGRRVRLSYRSRNEDRPHAREVDPWSLHVREGTWYVEAGDRRSGQIRTFRLDRIADLRVLDQPGCPRPPGSPVASPRYEPGPEDLQVELILGPTARWVAETVDADEVDELSDGRRRVVFRTDAPRWVRRVVLSASPAVTVVRPAELADAVRREARQTLARYTDGHR